MSAPRPAHAAHLPQTLLFWALGSALAGSIFWFNRTFFHDDAYISLRYAHHWLNGHGPVWNPGEAVQGYTNFLHLAVVTLLGHVLELRPAVRMLGVATWLAIIGLVVAHFRHVGETDQRHLSMRLLACLLVPSAPLMVWALGGLEGPWVSMWVLAAVLVHHHPSMRAPLRALVSGLFWALACLSRPDAALLLLTSIAFTARTRSLRDALLLLAIPAILGSLYFLWTWSFYGSLLPNTFHAKVSIDPLHRMLTGARYVGSWALTPPFTLLLCIAGLALRFRQEGWSRLPVLDRELTTLIGLYLIYIVYAGGDHMPAFRLTIPILPILVLLTIRTWTFLLRTPRIQVVATCLVFALSALQLNSSSVMPRQEDRAATVGRWAGQHIHHHWPHESLVALHTAGSTPFYAPNHRFIDMLGLNDRHIARVPIEALVLPWQHVPGHAKGDGGYVLDRSPDFIILGPALGTLPEEPWFLSDLQLAQDPRFAARYELRRGPLMGVGSHLNPDVFLYFRRISPPSEAEE